MLQHQNSSAKTEEQESAQCSLQTLNSLFRANARIGHSEGGGGASLMCTWFSSSKILAAAGVLPCLIDVTSLAEMELSLSADLGVTVGRSAFGFDTEGSPPLRTVLLSAHCKKLLLEVTGRSTDEECRIPLSREEAFCRSPLPLREIC